MSYHYCWKGYLYISWHSGGQQATFGLTPWPMLDMTYHHKTKGYNQLLCLTPELPLGMGTYLGEQLVGQQLTSPVTIDLDQVSLGFINQLKVLLGKKNKGDMNLIIEQLQDKIAKLLQQEELPIQWQQIESSEDGEVDLAISQEGQQVAELIRGKLLFPREILQAMSENFIDGLPPFQLKIILQLLYLQGECHLVPGISYGGQGNFLCNRCGTTEKLHQITCLDCGESCIYCEECQTMGESRLCRPLYGIPGHSVADQVFEQEANGAEEPIVPQLAFGLTQAQQDASNKLLRFVQQGGEQALVWAVCGAGKTEVAFAGIAHVLQRGGKVLFAIPRRDVVIELIPRLEKAFPQVDITALYGGSQGKYVGAQLVLATTHQAIRFYREFDLVVLDEVDAFPYKDNVMLHQAVQRAKKQQGQLVLMTATPSQELYKQAKQGKYQLIHIPARHHGYPVPEPQLLLGHHCKVQEKGKLVFSQDIMRFIHQTVEGDLAQLFIFAPSVFLTEQVGRSLQSRMKLPPFNDFHGEWVNYSHAKDPLRDEKRRRFAEGEYPIFVTTTIMERGITVARANVLVLYANYEKIFDQGTLVQMAGRAGRSSVYPKGKVLFVAESSSKAMEQAIGMIREQNLVAEKNGYLRQSLVATLS